MTNKLTSSIFTLILFLSHYAEFCEAQKPPNIVLMVADDLGIGDLGCFGNATMRTPNLDRLAAEGVRFTHDLATAAVCTPSRAAFQTGRYPIRMGMAPHNLVRVHLFSTNAGGLPSEEITIGEIAKSKGYTTGFIGKWHLGMREMHPNNQGYDYYYGLPISNSNSFGRESRSLFRAVISNLDVKLLGFAVSGLLFAYALRKLGLVGRVGYVVIGFLACVPAIAMYFVIWTGSRFSGLVMRNSEVVEQPVILEGFTDRLIQEGVEFLHNRKEDEQPFLLTMSWIQVHTALHSVRPFRGRSAHGPYGDEVEEMDWSVGEILNALDRFGMTKNTFVYFTSDHGGHMEERGTYGNAEGGWNGIYKGGKGQGGMEGGIRVPTLARWPGVIPSGTTTKVPTSHLDVLPTVAGIVGAQLPSDRVFDGVDIMQTLNGDGGRPHEFLVHYCGNLIHSARYTPRNGDDVFKVFYATHKYLPGKTRQCKFVCSCVKSGVNWHDPPILYNIARDPTEDQPLNVETAENKAILKKISELMESHRNTIKPAPSQFTLLKILPRPWLQECCNYPYCTCTERDSRL